MAASFNDQNFLSQDPTFINRVRQSLIAACVNITSEGWTVAFHRERTSFTVQIMNAPATFAPLFAQAVATDASCIADATVGGTVVLTSGNAATQAALVTDAHISNAISSQFNSFFRTPA